jgi:hypothetical protein
MTVLKREVSQICAGCGGKLTPLFYTLECARCDKPATGWFYLGYVVWTLESDALWEIMDHPIFRYRADAEAWKERQYEPSHFEVRYCLSYDKFVWDGMPGTLFEVATVMHKVKHTYKFDRNIWAVILLPRYTTLPPHSGQIYVDKDMAQQLGL